MCIDCFLICPQGASIIRMLQSFIGMNALQNGLKVYLDRHKFQNAETDDLWESLSETVRIRNIVWLFFACEFMLWQTIHALCNSFVIKSTYNRIHVPVQ